MEEIISDETNNVKNNSQQLYEKISEEKKNKNNYISTMNEEEILLWIKNLNLKEEISKELEKIIKNGKDLITIYNNDKILEKLNLDLHSNNIINDAIEKGLEEQLKINIYIEKDKNIILNIEHEPKYKLKELISYLEKLLKRSVYLSPYNSPNEILNPNTLIVKKILSNPNKYCNLQLFDEKTIRNNNNINLLTQKSDININLNKMKNEVLPLNNNDNLTNINNNNINYLNQNKNINKNIDLINTNANANINNSKMPNKSKGYTSLFQNKKNLADFSTDYQMPSQNKSNGNNFIKLSDTSNVTPTKQIEDFKYQKLLNKEKEENNIFNDMKFKNDNNNINEAKNIGFKNISSYKNMDVADNDNNNNNMNKNYLTQRNFNNSKTISNDTNNMMFQQILNKKRSEKNLSGLTGKSNIDNLGNDNNSNISFIERNKIDKEKDIFHLDFLNKDNNNEIKKQINNKTENRYEINSRFSDLDKDNIFKNKNIFNLPKTDPENNDINNLIINNQAEELKNSKEKYGFGNNLKEDSDNNILKILRDKYSLQNNDSKDSDSNRINFEIKGDYKPKTPINEVRRNINNDNMKYNNLTNITTDNSNNPLENKFLLQQKDDFIKFKNNFLNNNNQQMFNMKQEDDDDNNNLMAKYKIDMNIDKNNIGKNRMNRPSSGLEFNSFKYKAAGYKSSFGQDEGNINQYNQNNE